MGANLGVLRASWAPSPTEMRCAVLRTFSRNAVICTDVLRRATLGRIGHREACGWMPCWGPGRPGCGSAGHQLMG
jgi:hypothetical protein